MHSTRITPVILAGGKGTRLWPVSRAALPKQFCNLTQENSLFQQTVERLCGDENFSQPVVLTNEAYRSVVETQLLEIGFDAMQIICEPCARDTAAAIALATLSGKQNGAELLLAVPSDHKILDGTAFLKTVHEAAQIAKNTSKIVTFGINPTEPATQYGYLEAGGAIANSQGFALSRFIEKPNLDKAEKLVANDRIFWNAGIFMFSPEVMYNELYTHCPDLLKLVQASWNSGTIDQHCVYPDAQIYSEIKPISIDYAVMEKTIKAALVPVDPQWSDLGSWSAVWEASNRDADGNAVVGHALCTETSNSYLSSDGPLIGVAGVSDIVVVANRDAVLVTSRKDSQGVKNLIDKINCKHEDLTQKHAGETRPWGKFISLYKGNQHQVKTITVEPGGQLSLQYHFHRAEHWIVVQGTPTVTIDETVLSLAPCQQVFIPQGAVHRLENLTEEPVEIIEVQYGSYLGEDDIVRLEDVYGRSGVESDKPNDKVA